MTTEVRTTDAILTARSEGTSEEQHAGCSSSRSIEPGFTLLEVLVAFLIAALALGVLFRSGLSGLHAAQTASHYEQAIARAQSRLTAAVHASPLTSGDWQGDDGGGFMWHLRVAPIAAAAVRPLYGVTPRSTSTFPVTLYSVVVVIAWRDGVAVRQVRLDTEQIGQGAR